MWRFRKSIFLGFIFLNEWVMACDIELGQLIWHWAAGRSADVVTEVEINILTPVLK